MKVLQVHNFYRKPGGEDVVVRQEAALLGDRGHRVKLWSVTNDDIKTFWDKTRAALGAAYSASAKRQMAQEINAFGPDVVHVHNFFPLLTPSIYDACREARVPVVQTLHNYRIMCAGALLLRGGKVCEKCLTKSPYFGTFHGCYRNSTLASLPVSRMISYHQRRHTWRDKVDAFIALTDFARAKFAQGGLPEDKIHVKSNFIPDYYSETPAPKTSKGGLFVGRLSEWRGIDAPLTIVGGGPLRDELEKISGKNVRFLGQLAPDAVRKQMRKAAFMVMPSLWYEGFPMTLVEAMSMATPVIASDLGALSELVGAVSGKLLFKAGCARDLRQRLVSALDKPKAMTAFGQKSRKVFLKKYTPDQNYKRLMEIYRAAGRERS